MSNISTTGSASGAMLGLEQQIQQLFATVEDLKAQLNELTKGKMPGFYTYEQTAEHYSVSASTVKNWVKDGKLQVHYPNGTATPRISVADLIRLEDRPDIHGVYKKPAQVAKRAAERKTK